MFLKKKYNVSLELDENSEEWFEAKIEANEKINNWKKSLKGTNCKVCASIIKEVAA